MCLVVQSVNAQGRILCRAGPWQVHGSPYAKYSPFGHKPMLNLLYSDLYSSFSSRFLCIFFQLLHFAEHQSLPLYSPALLYCPSLAFPSLYSQLACTPRERFSVTDAADVTPTTTPPFSSWTAYKTTRAPSFTSASVWHSSTRPRTSRTAASSDLCGGRSPADTVMTVWCVLSSQRTWTPRPSDQA